MMWKLDYIKPLNLEEMLQSEVPCLIFHAQLRKNFNLLKSNSQFASKISQYAEKSFSKCFYVESHDPLSTLTIGIEEHHHIFCGISNDLPRHVWKAHPAYILGFWYLDPNGIHWNSSLNDKIFDPNAVSKYDARYFFNGVSSWHLKNNSSMRTQPARVSRKINEADAVVFFQNYDQQNPSPIYVSSEKMVTTVAQCCKGRVYAKLHPLQRDASREALIATCNELSNVELVDNSIHDLIAASKTVITQNSAAGFEALMQKKPVITCGKSDFYHGTLVAKNASQLKSKLDEAAEFQKAFEFEKYFYWFMGQNMVEPASANFSKIAGERIFGSL